MRAFAPLMLGLLLTCSACRADDFVRQGDVGEFCNGRDTDCRTGLLCKLAVCAEPGPPPTYDCADICARLDACQAAEPGCEADCRLTTTPWALRAREQFGVCVVEDLGCDDAQQAFGPQICYSRIAIPEARWTVCQDFVDLAQACGAANPEAERVLEGCAAIARVSPEAGWEEAARCSAVAETGICSELATCFSDELKLDPAPVW